MKEPVLTTEVVEDKNPRIEVDAAEIKVTAGPNRGEVIPLSVSSLLIGSGDDCGLVLKDSTVSARHAEILLTPRGYVIRDLGSTNGVVCGSTPIERAPLADGMKLRLGATQLVVRALGKRASIPLAQSGRFGGVVAHSVKMRACVAMLSDLAQADVTVLVEGETGTGKEVVAEAIHAHSSRKNGPFVVFDCGAVQPTLAGAELFGYEAGAFTGADKARAGLLEEAEGGTLFLDEIGELPLDLQPLLLAALERRRSRRIGGKTDRAHDLRVIAATNRNLAEEVRKKRFREDLYYRVAVARVRLPPLRERREDITVLADLFAKEHGLVLSPESLMPLAAYDWPGNVRELKNTVARMALRPDARPLESLSDDSHDPILEDAGQLRRLPDARRLANDEFERRYLSKALARAGGNLTRAAELAGISLRVMQVLAAKHGIRLRGK